MKLFKPIIGFFAVRHFKKMPAIPSLKIINKIKPVAGVHGIEFQQDKLVITENNPLVYWENIHDAPKNQIYYRDVINIDYEDNWILILLRTEYYHRLSKWGVERIYNHLYWDRTKGETWLAGWWYKL